MLKIKRTHNALLLITTFLLGGIVLPGVHELCHSLHSYQASETYTVNVPVHLDIDVLGTRGKHAGDLEKTCKLCALILAGIHTQNVVDTFYDSGSYLLASVNHVALVSASTFFIRGPPVHMVM